MSNPVYKNNNYVVYVNETNDGYIVVNTVTGVHEVKCEALPEAMSVAEQLNAALVHSSHEWIARAAVREAAEERGSFEVVEPH